MYVADLCMLVKNKKVIDELVKPLRTGPDTFTLIQDNYNFKQ